MSLSVQQTWRMGRAHTQAHTHALAYCHGDPSTSLAPSYITPIIPPSIKHPSASPRLFGTVIRITQSLLLPISPFLAASICHPLLSQLQEFSSL